MFSEELMIGKSMLLLLEPPSGGILIIRALELLFKECLRRMNVKLT